MNNLNVIEVLTVDAHPLVRGGIPSLIRRRADMALTPEATTGPEAIRYFGAHHRDLTLMDIRLPDMRVAEVSNPTYLTRGDPRVPHGRLAKLPGRNTPAVSPTSKSNKAGGNALVRGFANWRTLANSKPGISNNFNRLRLEP
jgi:CheY-like chemotaxis protein